MAYWLTQKCGSSLQLHHPFDKGKTIMDEKEIINIHKKMAELEVLIAETKKRLPARSIKPPVMLDLLEYEDEYDLLLKRLNEQKMRDI